MIVGESNIATEESADRGGRNNQEKLPSAAANCPRKEKSGRGAVRFSRDATNTIGCIGRVIGKAFVPFQIWPFMYLIEIFLPLADNDGGPFSPSLFDSVRKTLTATFGGLTAF